MSNELKLGTIPTGTEGRDAVHIAIVPARATRQLTSGSPVKLNDKTEAESCLVEDAIGVVDPFRPEGQRTIPKGSWFWLCLYPQTITGLRHVWEHPAFPPSAQVEFASPADNDSAKKAVSEDWLRKYIQHHCPYWIGNPKGYDEFLRYVKEDRWIFYYGSDCHNLDDVADAEELFHHLSVVLGMRIDASYFEAFACSC